MRGVTYCFRRFLWIYNYAEDERLDKIVAGVKLNRKAADEALRDAGTDLENKQACFSGIEPRGIDNFCFHGLCFRRYGRLSLCIVIVPQL